MEPEPFVRVEKPKTVQELIAYHADRYNVSASVMDTVIKCESRYQNVQSSIINRKGEREDSWGVSQIHLPSWRGQITKEQALDKNFAVEFMARKISEGQGRLWTCYRTHFG